MDVKSYAIAPRVVLRDSKISMGAKVVYFVLVDYAFNNIFCFPKVETIAEHLGMGENSVKGYLKELREYGLIKVWQRGLGKSNYYILMPLGSVKNLNSTEKWLVPRDEQYITEEEFNILVKRIEEIKEGKEVPIEPIKEIKIDKTKERYEKNINGNRKRMSSTDLVTHFCVKYKEMYGEDYKPSWKSEPKAINDIKKTLDIDSEMMVQIIETFIDCYDVNFKKGEFKRPRVGFMKVEFILKRILEVMALREERESLTNVTEIVDEF